MAAGSNARRGSSSDEGLDIDGFRGLDRANNSTIASATSASIRPELLALRGVGGEHSNADVKLLRVFEGDFGFVWYRLRDVVPRYASIDWKRGSPCLSRYYAGRVKREAPARRYPHQMVANFFYAGHVLRGYDQSLTRSFVGDRAPQLDHAVAYDRIHESHRCPRLLRYLRHQRRADGVVALCDGLELAGGTSEGVQKIGTAHDSDHVPAPHDGHSLYLMFLP